MWRKALGSYAQQAGWLAKFDSSARKVTAVGEPNQVGVENPDIEKHALL